MGVGLAKINVFPKCYINFFGDIMKVVLKLSLVLIVFFALTILYLNGIKVRQADWYDFGNGLINLSNVSVIKSQMNFGIILKEKDENGLDIEIVLVDAVISKENLENFKTEISKYKDKWESVTYKASINFDLFTLKLQTFETASIPLLGNSSCIELVNFWVKQLDSIKARVKPYNSIYSNELKL
jgi:hypothetical protein